MNPNEMLLANRHWSLHVGRGQTSEPGADSSDRPHYGGLLPPAPSGRRLIYVQRIAASHLKFDPCGACCSERPILFSCRKTGTLDTAQPAPDAASALCELSSLARFPALQANRYEPMGDRSILKTKSALIGKLRAYIDLDDDEAQALSRILTHCWSISCGRDIVVQGQPYHALYVMIDGLSLRYKILSNSRRQVLNLVIPGDLISLPACLFEGALASASGLTNVAVGPIEFADPFDLFHGTPASASPCSGHRLAKQGFTWSIWSRLAGDQPTNGWPS